MQSILATSVTGFPAVVPVFGAQFVPASGPAINDMEEIFRTTRIRLGLRKWTREELHER